MRRAKASDDGFVLAQRLMAALPESWGRIEQIMRQPITKGNADQQFCLMMFFDEIFDAARHRSLRPRCIALVEELLSGASRDPGLAAWKAADFLADHTPLEASLESLVRVMKSGRYWLGRDLVVSAVACSWRRAGRAQQRVLLDVLQDVSASDRSGRVRASAQRTLAEIGRAKG